MKTNLFKIIISTALMVPFSSFPVLANSNEAESDPVENIEMEEDTGSRKTVMLYSYINGGDWNNEQQINLPVSGTDGVNWLIDENHVLYFEEGELSRDDSWRQYKNCIREIRVTQNEGGGKVILPENCNMLFSELRELTYIDLSGFDASKVIDMGFMFVDCPDLQSLDLSGFNTREVLNMTKMFEGCTSLKELDLSGLDTRNVEDMSWMFGGCTKLQDLNLSGMDTSKVTNMNSMFQMCTSLKELDLSGLNTSRVSEMADIFSDCSGLKDLDLSNIDTSHVSNFSSMFTNCSSLESVDVSNFDTSKARTMLNMFAGCTALQSLDLSSFDTSHVKNMVSMFADCRNLETLNLSSFDTSGVWYCGSRLMFSRCDSLRQINLSTSFFKGDLIDCCLFTDLTPLVKLGDRSICKYWSDVKKEWKEEDNGWWGCPAGCTFLSFDANGGTEVPPLCESKGNTVNLALYSSSKSHYNFTGWFLDRECTQKAGLRYILNGPTTLYAGWKLQDRSLIFMTNGGLEMSPVVRSYGSTVEIKRYTPLRKGYIFTGWYSDPDCTKKAEDQITLNSDTTVYAGWQRDPSWLAD